MYNLSLKSLRKAARNLKSFGTSTFALPSCYTNAITSSAYEIIARIPAIMANGN